MFRCPDCPASFPTQFLLTNHITRVHPRPGWFEQGTPQIVDNGRVELRAIEHQLAATRDKLAQQRTISAPIPAPPSQKEQLIPSRGWVQKSDNSYVFEHELYQHSTPIETVSVVISAELNQKHGRCLKHEYTKNLTELERLKQDEVKFESDLRSLTTSHPAYHKVARSILETKEKIIKFNRNIRPDGVHALILEDYYRFDLGTDENTKWMKNFMDEVNKQFDLMKENYHRQHEINKDTK